MSHPLPSTMPSGTTSRSQDFTHVRRLLAAALLFGLVLSTVFLPRATHGQSYLPQAAVAKVLNNQNDTLSTIPEVDFRYHVVEEDSRLRARLQLYHRIGKENRFTVQLLNRSMLVHLRPGDTLVVPEKFDVDWRAYSPFPRYYPAADTIGKIVILNKAIQAFAAYSHGRLQRWGLANAGQKPEATPNGRYNFNWQTEYKRSSLNPDWEMYWVMNFHRTRGLHLHQYALPTGGPASHGCVRLLEADAKWLYHWIDTWDTGEDGAVLDQGTLFIIYGENTGFRPRLFDFKPSGPALKTLALPGEPYQIPPATEQQEYFDRLRKQNAE